MTLDTILVNTDYSGAVNNIGRVYTNGKSPMTAIVPEVTITKPTLYDITVTAATNGTVTPNKTRAEAGETIALTVAPSNGYRLVEGSLKFNENTVSGMSFVMPAANVTITAEFELIQYPITVAPMENGDVTPNKGSAAAGETITLTILPSTGYQLVPGSLKYNDITVSGTSFVMPAVSVTITAEFEKILYPITVAPMQNGTVTPSKTSATAGETIILTVTPNNGYRLVEGSLKYNESVVSGGGFMMPPAGVTITAEFELIPPTLYDITVTAATNGTVTPNKTRAEAGETITLTVAPSNGYRLVEGSLKFNGTVVSGTSFTMPAANVTITAEFEQIPPTLYDITVTAAANGTVTPNKTRAEAGETITLTVTPNNG
jgi:hypothetical protein